MYMCVNAYMHICIYGHMYVLSMNMRVFVCVRVPECFPDPERAKERDVFQSSTDVKICYHLDTG